MKNVKTAFTMKRLLMLTALKNRLSAGTTTLRSAWRFRTKRAAFPHARYPPLKAGEVVEVLEMADEDDCMSDMIVIIRFGDRTVGVPLAQLEPTAGMRR